MSQVSYGTITITDTNDIERIYMVYAGSESNTNSPDVDNFALWKTDVTQTSGTYIWQRVVAKKSGIEITATNFQQFYSDPVCVTGEGGRSIKSITTYYCNYGEGTPIENYNGWGIEVPEYDENKPNYWVKTVVIYVDDSEEEFELSGNIVTIEDGVHKQITSVLTAIDPIQDLHGYDKPWSGGAGKNKLDKASVATVDKYIDLASNYFYTAPIMLKSNTEYTISPTSTSGLGVTDYWVLYINLSADDADYLVITNPSVRYPVESGTPKAIAFTTGATGAIRFGVTNVGNQPKASALTAFMSINYQIEEGSTSSAWTPYSNICPISGRTECVTSVCGVNVWDEEYKIGTYNTNTAVFEPNNTHLACKNPISVKPNTAYRYQTNGYKINVCYLDAEQNYIDNFNSVADVIMTTPNDCHFIVFNMAKAYGTTYNHDISINYPSTDTDYHAFDGHTYTTDLGRTVYGGSLDVVSGELKVTHAVVDLGTLGWNYDNTSYAYGFFTSTTIGMRKGGSLGDACCSQYAINQGGRYSLGSGTGQIASYNEGASTSVCVRDDNYADATAFKTAMDGAQLVYELAEPQTIQLTPTEVELLVSDNNIWTNISEISINGFTIVDKDVQIYLNNGLTDAITQSVKANKNASDALDKANNGIAEIYRVWYRTNTTTAPNKPSIHVTSTANDVNNTWTKVKPVENTNNRYYFYCEETIINGGKSSWTEPVLDTSNLSQYEIEVLTAKVKNYWWDSTGAHIASGIGGADVIQNNVTTYGFNSLVGLSNIKFRYNAIPLIEMGILNNGDFNGIKLYNPILTGSVITSSSLDATLTSEGLKLVKGGIEGGTASSGSNGYVYLSTEDKAGISINGFRPTDSDPKWRQIIGTQFGVLSDGTIYASNANIEGAITATSLTIGNGSSSYNGIAAMNINGYSIEIIIDSTGVADTATSTYLYPQLYHNGSKVDYFLSTDTSVDLSKTYYTRSGTAGNYTYTVVTNPSGNPSVNQYYEHIDYGRFLWYQDDNSIGTAGDVNHYGRCLGIYGHTYRVIYEFDDGEVGGSTEVQTRLVDPSKYITKINDTGITVHPEVWESSSSYLQLNGNGLYIKDLNDEELAYFTANGVQIGKSSESHLELDYHSMQMKDKEGVTYMYVSDFRDRNGEANITDSFIADGTETAFDLSLTPTNNTYIVTVSDDSGGTITKTTTHIVFSSPPTAGATITINYKTASADAKAYSLGNRNTSAIGAYSVIEGKNTLASGNCSHAEGRETKAIGERAHAEGYRTEANGSDSHAEGVGTKATGTNSHAEGIFTTASGWYAHAEGNETVASGPSSHAEGSETAASGSYSHAEGENTRATSMCSHAEGENTTASNVYTHAEGQHTQAGGQSSHAEGRETMAFGKYSHTEGCNTYIPVTGSNAHAEGLSTRASGNSSHAEGDSTEASGSSSHAGGCYTIAQRKSQTTIGEYNEADTSGANGTVRGDYVFIIGNGTANDARSNALAVTWDGNVEMALDTTASSGADYDLYTAISTLGWASTVIE